LKKPIPTADMPKEEWRKLRRELGIGGSEAAAILGQSKFSTPLRVYLDKLGKAPEVEESEAIRIGNDLEDYVAKRFAEASGLTVRRHNQIMFHPDHEWMFANIDRKVSGDGVDGFVGLECKTTNAFNPTDFSDGNIQANYYWQCQHYMAVTGAKYWYLAVLVLGVGFHVFKVERDGSAISALIEAEEDFWLNHVCKEIPPLPTGSDTDDEMIDIINDEEIDDDEEADLIDMKNDLDARAIYKAQIKSLENSVNEIDQRIKLRLNTYTKAVCGTFYTVTYRSQESGRLDTKRLKKEMPEIYERFKNNRKIRTLNIREIKEDND